MNNDSFGGDNWIKICDGLLKLNSASGTMEMVMYIDHIYDLQHNNGSIFDKSERFEKNGSHSWVKKALDFKKYANNPWKLWEKCSPGLKKFMARIIKAYTGSTYEADQSKETIPFK